MSKESRFKIESKGMFASFLFYAIVGILCFAALPLSGYPPHLGLLGIFSLIAAYGLFKKRNWTTWFVVILFFMVTIFTLYTFYYVMWTDIVLAAMMIVYLAVTVIFTAYTLPKRHTFEG
jgi:sensor histidine kinase YesM